MNTRALACLPLMLVGLVAACDDAPAPSAPPRPPVFARGGNGSNNGRILFVSDRDNSDGTLDIYSMNADGTGVTRLTNDPALDHWGVLSPDGKKVVFASTRHDPSFDIYVMNSDGTGVTRLTNSSGLDVFATWSKDGKKIAFASTRASGVPDRTERRSARTTLSQSDDRAVTR
jgi:Tol biopolymer transport system component